MNNDKKFLKKVQKKLLAYRTARTFKQRVKVIVFLEKHFEMVVVDISAASDVFDITLRYVAQVCDIPSDERGSLAKYRGKRVMMIPTVIDRSGPRIYLLIKEVN